MDIMNVVENTLVQFVGLNACYYAIAAIGLNVQFGYTGLLNFGQAAFMAAGAYGLGQTVSVMGISMWWGIGLGIVYSIFLGLLMGVPTLRLRADYLAIVTIAVAEVVRLMVRSVWARDVFGGTDGLKDFAKSFQQLGADLGIEPGQTYGFWAFKFSGQRSMGADRRLVAGGDLRVRRLAVDAQPVGTCAEGDPRGRGGRAQPRQERLQLQDAGAHPGRRDRYLRRHDPGARHRQRAARQLQPGPDVLHPHRPRAGRHRQGHGLDRRPDAVLGPVRVPRQLPARARLRRSRCAGVASRSSTRPRSARWCSCSWAPCS